MPIPEDPPHDITQLLVRLRDGQAGAADELVPLVYGELRSMARRRLAQQSREATLSATALVHEAYLRLFDQTRLSWNDRRHFFSVASIAMRQIVVDHARRRGAKKRGGGMRRVDLDVAGVSFDDATTDILALDDALRRLSVLNERLGRVVELRFFGGLSVEETAEVLGVTDRTVKRDWRKARAFLFRELSDGNTA